jgi:hypothetical protein
MNSAISSGLAWAPANRSWNEALLPGSIGRPTTRVALGKAGRLDQPFLRAAEIAAHRDLQRRHLLAISFGQRGAVTGAVQPSPAHAPALTRAVSPHVAEVCTALERHVALCSDQAGAVPGFEQEVMARAWQPSETGAATRLVNHRLGGANRIDIDVCAHAHRTRR